MTIGKIKRIPLREVWKHEAFDFTAWLVENIDVLNEELDLTLVTVEREQKAGCFSVDLVAEDNDGNTVVIENQLEKSNHDHLGKIITYLTNLDAKSAIWIVSDPRPEHVKAIAWLNESSSASFYLFKMEAVQISDSPPAPLLTLIVGPSEEAKELGETKKEWAEREKLRYRFFEQLLARAKERTSLHAHLSPTQGNWVGMFVNLLGLTYVVRQHDTNVELYIDRDHGRGEGNKKIFDDLLQKKDQIEKDFGEPLTWMRLDQKRASRIKKDINVGGYNDPEEKWPEIHDAMIDNMVRLEKALKPHISKLKV